MEQEISINTQYIKLDSFLKLCGEAVTGGHAKILIEDETVSVNGELCIQRGKKLYPGDKVETDGRVYIVAGE